MVRPPAATDATPPSRSSVAQVLSVSVLVLLLSVGLIAVVNRNLMDQPLLAAFTLLLGAAALSLLTYVLLQQEVLYRLTALKTGLSAEQIARNAAEELAQEKSRLLATMTHEIRTPLNGVIGMLGLLLETELSAEQRNYAATAHGSGRILLSIIDEILDGAKSEALRKNSDAEVDIVALVENVTELLAPRAHAKDIGIVTHFAPDVPQVIHGNDMRLRQLLFNIAGNAIKFTEKGGVSIEVSRSGSDGMAFVVRDTGIGMTPKELDRIFKPFEQANDQTTRRFGGTGLGLGISLRIVEALGGVMKLDSTPGVGTSFTVILPRLLKRAPEPRASNALAGRRFRLLLSDAFTATHFERQLKVQGASVVQMLDSSHVAVATLLNNTLDAIVCDRHSGPRLLAVSRKLSRSGKPLPQIWILLTPDERRPLQHLLKAPLTGYLMQPVRSSTLVDQLTSRDSAHIRTAAAQLRTITTRAKSAVSLNVLLADDTVVNTIIARTMLEKAGHDVRVVNSGAAAITAIETSDPFDILLLDMEMPGLSGPETAALIRAKEAQNPQQRRLPILALTANTRPESVEACLAAGMDGHLAKPFDRQDLESWILRLAEQKAA
jgi:signal transduction histidine kinase/CheY-like chemotaxis protein